MSLDDEMVLDLVANGCSCGGIGGTGKHLEGCRWFDHDRPAQVIADPDEHENTDAA